MMAPCPGGRPGSSRRVRLVPVRRSGMDHRAVARIVLALARQMAADEAVESSAEQTGSRRSGAMRAASSMSARHCMTEHLPHCRHDGARYLAHGTPSTTSHAVTDRAGAAESDEDAAPSSSTASHAASDRAGAAESDEAAAPSSTPGGTP